MVPIFITYENVYTKVLQHDGNTLIIQFSSFGIRQLKYNVYLLKMNYSITLMKVYQSINLIHNNQRKIKGKRN